MIIPTPNISAQQLIDVKYSGNYSEMAIRLNEIIRENNLNQIGGYKMANLKEEATAYESTATKNISELLKVSTDLEVLERTGTNDEGKEFSYKYITVEGFDYRVPASVLKNLKAILEDNPNLKHFKVRKTGQGMSTEYTVIPLG